MTWQKILKGYDLDAFIKAPKRATKKAKKEKVVRVGSATVTVVTTASLSKLLDDIKAWHTKCQSLKLEAIGITGQKGNTSLLEHCMDHVETRVQRPKQPARHGAMETLDEIMKIVKEEDAYTHEDLKRVKDFIEDLEDIEGPTKSSENPRNIPFTEVRDPQNPEKKTWVRGHYRTEWFAEQNPDYPAVPSSWYEYGPNRSGGWDTAKPPFWQALFASEAERGDLIPLGLLTLLKQFAEEMVEQPLTDLTIKGARARESITKVKGFMGGLKTILRNQQVYRSQTKPFDRLWINFAAVQRALGDFAFQVNQNSKNEVEATKKLLGVEDLVGTLKDWKVKQISIRLLRTIFTGHRGINLENFKHGAFNGIFLRKPITVGPKGDGSRKVLFEKEKAKATRSGDLPAWADDTPPDDSGSSKDVKKSWVSMLRKAELKPPTSKGHAPKIFSKDKQEEISEAKDETCDYCSRPVALDCAQCGQKLCRQHLSKPCVRAEKDKSPGFSW